MIPTSSFLCFRCGLNVAYGTRRCPGCNTVLAGTPQPDTVQDAIATLRTQDGHPVPLLGVALGGEVFGAHARLVLRQRYKNRESKPIEAVYTFPIPSDATLVGFAMECEGRRVEAEVKEREEAFAAYDDAVAKGHGAALLEQERPNVFTASVGNLLPDEETVVEVTFLQKLTADEGALRLMVPTLVAPRYIPGVPLGDRTGHGAAAPTDAVPDADRISPKIGDVRYGLSMDIVFDLGREVTIESPSHAVEVIEMGSDGGLRRRVRFASREVALDRDLVLVAEGASRTAGVAAGVVCDKQASEEGTFALTLVPDLFEAKKRSNGRAAVFVVDVSGSMAGASIEQAKRALRLCLRHLGEGDLFDIVPFNSSYSHFSQQLTGARGQAADLIPFTQMTLKEADRYVDALDASGGTEMLQPLEAAARLLAGRRHDRVIVLLTDGQVGNEAQIIEEIAKQTAGARMYTFGIGTNVSDLLLRELAKRTKGAVEFIHPGERIDEKVTAQFARATAARVEAIRVKWIGVDAGEVAPGEPPALIDGEPWSVYGRYETAGIGRAEIRGTLAGEPFYLEVPLDLVESANRPSLTSLWAGARVRDLEQVDGASLGRRADAHKRRIVDLCVRHGIASKYASFVVVEKRTGDRRVQGQPETRAVPVNAPAGWAGAAQGRRAAGMTGGPGVQYGGGGPGAAPRSMATMRLSQSAPGRTGGYGAPSGGRGAPPPSGAPRGKGGMPAPIGAMPPAAFSPSVPVPAFAAPARPPMAPAPMAGQAKDGDEPLQRAKRKIDLKQPLGVSREASPSAAAASAVSRVAEAPDYAARSRGVDVEMRSAGEDRAFGGAPEGGEIGAVFARQLASGLWESGDGSDNGLLLATTACLERCVQEGIDTSHPVYGAQLIKAIDALCAVAEVLALAGDADGEVGRALLAMAAVSTGKRARTRIAAIAGAATSAAVRSLAAHLASQEAARKQVGLQPR